MPAKRLSRKLLSLASVLSFWSDSEARRPAGARPCLERLEDRTLPAVDAFTLAGGTILVVGKTNDNTANDLITLDNNAGQLKVSSTNKFLATSALGANATDFTVNNIQLVLVEGTSATKVTNLTVDGGLENVTSLKTLNYKGSPGPDAVNMTANTDDNLYAKIDTSGGAGNTVSIGAKGVVVLNYTDSIAAGSSDVIATNANNSKVGLYFKGVATGGVSVNLRVDNTGGAAPANFATFSKGQLLLAAGSSAAKITAVYGSPGNDVLIGNDAGDELVGGGGNDSLTGGAGNDLLASTRDFSPAFAGTSTGGVAATTFGNDTSGDTVVDLSKFATANGQFAGSTGVSATSVALYSAFGFFNFGEGGSFVQTGTVDFSADFATANAIAAAANTVTMTGGAGNDGFFGFNGASTFANGSGNDVFSTNLNGGTNVWTAGAGGCLMVGHFGDSLIGGAGNDTFTIVAGGTTPPGPNNVTHLIGGRGTNTLSFNANARFVSVDAGDGNGDAILVDPTANDPSNVLLANASTNLAQLAGAPLIRVVSR